MNKPVYLGLSILEISKTLMYEFWCGYITPKYQSNAILCYMDTDSSIIHTKTEDFYKDIADDIKKDMIHQIMKLIDHYQKEWIKKSDWIKDKLGVKIITEFVALTPKTYSYVTDDDDKNVKKAKGTKKCVLKRTLKFNDYKNCLFKTILKSQQRFTSEAHCIYSEEINKIALSSNTDKRLQTFDRITTYPYGPNPFKACESEMLSKYKWLILIIILMKIKHSII